MLILTNSSRQKLGKNEVLIFDRQILHTGKWEQYRNESGLIELRARNAIYEVHFSADIYTKDAGAAQLAIGVDGTPLAETYMTSSVDGLNNVAKTTAIKTNDDVVYISVINVGSTHVMVNHSSLFTKRTA